MFDELEIRISDDKFVIRSDLLFFIRGNVDLIASELEDHMGDFLYEY